MATLSRLPFLNTGSRTGGVFEKLRKSRLLRTILSSLFILFMLAAAHLFMVVINAAERHVAAPDASVGMEARLFGDRPLVEELEIARSRARSPEDLAVVEAAIVRAEAGEPVELRTLPVTDFMVWACLGLCFFGVLLIWSTSLLKSDAAQTIVGIFGGNLIWTGGVEYGLLLASRTLGVGKAIGVENGDLVAIYGEYVLLKYSWGFLLMIIAYLLFLESSRCSVFVWWRRKVPTMRGPVVSGRISNYGPRSAFQYVTTVWFFYLLLLWAYDENVMGVYSYATKAILLGSLAGTIYCLYRLHQQTGWGAAVRYAIAAMCVAWTPVEIIAKWGILREPWLLLEPGTALFFFGGLGLGTWALLRAQQRRSKAPPEGCPMHAQRAADNDASSGSEGLAA